MSPARSRRLAAGLAASLLGLAVARLIAFGWAGVGPDDARYLYVGLSLLDGHGPVTADGNVFLLRSPLYGAMLAIGARVATGDPLLGAHLTATVLWLLALLGAVRLGWLLGGAGGGFWTAVAIAATPLLWGLLPTVQVDLAQTAGVIAVLLLAHRPTVPRWGLAGLALGLTVLVKESALPLALLPAAALPAVAVRRLAALTAAYVGAAVAIAAPWWVVVWVHLGEIFPINALRVIESRRVGTDLDVTPLAAGLVVLFVFGWIGLIATARRRSDRRLLAVAALLLGPAAGYAILNGLDARNFAELALLSSIALGVCAADLGGRIAAWLDGAALPAKSLGRAPGAGPRRAFPRASTVVIGVVGAAVAATIVGAQLRAPPAGVPPLPAMLAGWLGARVGSDERVVMTFRYRALVAVELYGRTTVAELRPTRVAATDDPAAFVWIGLRDEQLFGYTRTTWSTTLGDPATRYFVVVEPHDFVPAELLQLARSPSVASPGFIAVATLAPGGPSATIFAVDPALAAVGGGSTPLHLGAEAAAAWLDLARAAGVPEDVAVSRLVAAGPIVVGPPDSRDSLLTRLGGAACAVPAGAPYGDDAVRVVRLEPDRRCPASG